MSSPFTRTRARPRLTWNNTGGDLNWSADSVLNGSTTAGPGGDVLVGDLLSLSGISVLRACLQISTTDLPGFDPTAVQIGWVADVDGTNHVPPPSRNQLWGFTGNPWNGRSLDFPPDANGLMTGSGIPAATARKVRDYPTVGPPGGLGNFVVFMDCPAWYAPAVRLYLKNFDQSVSIAVTAKYLTAS